MQLALNARIKQTQSQEHGNKDEENQNVDNQLASEVKNKNKNNTGSDNYENREKEKGKKNKEPFHAVIYYNVLDEDGGRLSPSNYIGKKDGDLNDLKNKEEGVTKVKVITQDTFTHLIYPKSNKNVKHFDVSFVQISVQDSIGTG